MKRKTILFDLDGTLTDPKVGITNSVAYALEKQGIQVADKDALCVFIGPPLLSSFMEFYGMKEIQAKQAIIDYRVYFEKAGMLENEVYEGIEECLSTLVKKGNTLLVATSKPQVYAKEILEYFHLDTYFMDICGSELDGTRSKKAEVIAYALHKHQLDPTNCVMVGDRKHDIEGAKEHQVMSVGVLYGYGSWEELHTANTDQIVSSIAELQQFLCSFI